MTAAPGELRLARLSGMSLPLDAGVYIVVASARARRSLPDRHLALRMDGAIRWLTGARTEVIAGDGT